MMDDHLNEELAFKQEPEYDVDWKDTGPLVLGKKGQTPFFNMVRTFVQNLTPKWFLSNDELLFILKRNNFVICEHSSFLLLTKLSLKPKLEFRNLKKY